MYLHQPLLSYSVYKLGCTSFFQSGIKTSTSRDWGWFTPPYCGWHAPHISPADIDMFKIMLDRKILKCCRSQTPHISDICPLYTDKTWINKVDKKGVHSRGDGICCCCWLPKKGNNMPNNIQRIYLLAYWEPTVSFSLLNSILYYIISYLWSVPYISHSIASW